MRDFISCRMRFHSSPRVGSHSYRIPPYIISLLAVWAISLLPALFLYPAVYYFIACRLGTFIVAGTFFISHRAPFHSLAMHDFISRRMRFHSSPRMGSYSHRRLFHILPYIISLLAVWALLFPPAHFSYPAVRHFIFCRILFHCSPSGRFHCCRHFFYIPPYAFSFLAMHDFISRRMLFHSLLCVPFHSPSCVISYPVVHFFDISPGAISFPLALVLYAVVRLLIPFHS
jgi:hypothetical protein